MSSRQKSSGFTLIEVLVTIGIFLLFTLGVYGGLQLVFKIVYQSRLRLLETSVLSAELETARNIPFGQVGIAGGLPAGLLPHSKNITRNGIVFNIITTVRNIDDPFDGTLGGNPNDTSPADYKLVEMSIICANCEQQTSVILNTMVAPKGLEGASQNGALFVQVFDASGHAVSGANVHVVNEKPNPDLVIDDTTANDGWLKIIDTPTGTLAYHITVSKNGYSTDSTLIASEQVVNPMKPPSTVISQTVTEISFAIDKLSNLDIHTVNPNCSALGNIAFGLHGEKILGQNPNVYKYSQNLSTDGSGNKSLLNLEWDNYALDFTGTGYDVAGAGPMLPLKLNPGADQDLTIVLRPHVANSFLVKVNDAGTGLPLSNATVRLFDSTYDKSLTTGLGYTRQTDWSGGSGQLNFVNNDEYFSDSGTIDINSPAGDIKLKKVGQNYLNNGWLESSILDLGTAVNFNGIIWIPTTPPAQTGVDPITFQIAASDTSTPAVWNYKGPDGESTSYYTVSNNMIWAGHNGSRYLRYKVFLSTADEDFTPQLSEVAFTYITACVAPGQSFFNDIGAGTYTLEVSKAGYSTNSGTVDVNGTGDTVVSLSE